MDSRICAAVAVSRTDGTPFPESMSDETYDDIRFFMSPLIRGVILKNIIWRQ